MLAVFREAQQKQIELERLRILAQANEITYRQKGEVFTAERFQKLKNCLATAVSLLEECNGDKAGKDALEHSIAKIVR